MLGNSIVFDNDGLIILGVNTNSGFPLAHAVKNNSRNLKY